MTPEQMEDKLKRVWTLLLITSDELHEIEALGGDLSLPLEDLWGQMTEYIEWQRDRN